MYDHHVGNQETELAINSCWPRSKNPYGGGFVRKPRLSLERTLSLSIYNDDVGGATHYGGQISTNGVDSSGLLKISDQSKLLKERW